jgi:hypothetical protein
MIVMLMLVMVFVMSAVIAKANFTSEASFCQELQRSIDSRLTNRRIFLFYQAVEIFVREMCFCFQKYIEDEVSLRRTFQALFLNVFKKYFLLFGHC